MLYQIGLTWKKKQNKTKTNKQKQKTKENIYNR